MIIFILLFMIVCVIYWVMLKPGIDYLWTVRDEDLRELRKKSAKKSQEPKKLEKHKR